VTTPEGQKDAGGAAQQPVPAEPPPLPPPPLDATQLEPERV
jgi:hypothetical protein